MTDFADLVDGYQRFRTSDWRRQHDRWEKLKVGQEPRVMVIACSDSRVEPAQIFDTLPGEMFVVRNVANLVPPFETGGGYHGVSAAVEFAVTQLKVGEIVVLGHGQCGGCKAALAGTFDKAERGQGGFISDWVHLLDGARESVAKDHADLKSEEAREAMEQAAVRTSIDNLRTFPFVRDAEAAGDLEIRGAVFAIDDGILRVMDEDGGFTPAQPRAD
ncbi:carbonic anhydrase [Sphingomonas aerolata]|uniref:carbonic anhydrase n=1 Tax=Sphingomonas aerolata TaxID=185951 RepID=UPI00334C2C76